MLSYNDPGCAPQDPAYECQWRYVDTVHRVSFTQNSIFLFRYYCDRDSWDGLIDQQMDDDHKTVKNTAKDLNKRSMGALFS